MIYTLIGLNIISFAFQSIFLKKVKASTFSENILVTSTFSFLAGLPLLIWTIIAGNKMSLYTVLMGIIFGILFSVSICTYSLAMKVGPLSYTNFIYSSSMLIPSIAGLFIWGEKLTIQFCASIVLFLISFYFISITSGKQSKDSSMRWLILSFLSFALGGFASLILKIHQITMDGMNPAITVGVSFTMTGLISAIIFVIYNKSAKVNATAILRVNIQPITVVAICTAIGNLIQTYLSSSVEGSYLYPTVLGGSMVFVTIASIKIFNERLNKKGFFGIFIGICAIIILNI